MPCYIIGGRKSGKSILLAMITNGAIVSESWPYSSKPGYPVLYRKSGWHLTRHKSLASPTCLFWCHERKAYTHYFTEWYTPEQLIKMNRVYIGPVIAKQSLLDLINESTIAWSVCASLHRTFCKGLDAVFSTRQKDFTKSEEASRNLYQEVDQGL